MKLIDADDAIERLGAYLMADAQIEWGGTASEDIEDWKELASDILKGAPSIDIVRCGECKYWIDDRKVEEDMGTCGLTHYFTNADDFCSYGMRNADSNTLNTLDALDDNSSEKPNNCEPQTEREGE